MDRLPTATLSPLASRVDEVLALHEYEIRAAIDATDAAVTGFGGLFDPETADGEIRTAIDEILAGDPPSVGKRRRETDGSDVDYVLKGVKEHRASIRVFGEISRCI